MMLAVASRACPPTVERIDGSPSTSGLRFKIKVKV
jgi:hypothetical protein